MSLRLLTSQCMHHRKHTTTTCNCRPDCPIYALTDREDVRRRLALRWGVQPFVTQLTSDFEGNVQVGV